MDFNWFFPKDHNFEKHFQATIDTIES